jgi:hypothetical protein
MPRPKQQPSAKTPDTDMPNQACGASGSSDESASNSSSIYVVNLLKREYDGFGFLVRQRDQRPYFSIWEIIKGGAAEFCGKIKRGDIIIRVNGQDLANASYEGGLDILKTVKPGSMAEFVMQTGSKSDIDLMARYDKAMTSQPSGAPNGFMSPLQKIKQKFVSCASTTTTTMATASGSAPQPRPPVDAYSPAYSNECVSMKVKETEIFEASTKLVNGKLKTETSQIISMNASSIPNSPIFTKVDRVSNAAEANNIGCKSPEMPRRQNDNKKMTSGDSESSFAPQRGSARSGLTAATSAETAAASLAKKSLQVNSGGGNSESGQQMGGAATVHRIPVQHHRHQQHLNLNAATAAAIKKSADEGRGNLQSADTAQQYTLKSEKVKIVTSEQKRDSSSVAYRNKGELKNFIKKKYLGVN